MVAPFWGNDFGAALSAVPGVRAHGVAAARAGGSPCAACSAVGGVAVGAVVAIGLLDLTRPADERTHVGKFFSQLFHDAEWRDARDPPQGGGEPLGARALGPALRGRSWSVARRVPLVRVAAAHPGAAGSVPTTHATLVGFVTVAVLGFVLNDSGVTIPGIMFSVFEAALVYVYATVSSRQTHRA